VIVKSNEFSEPVTISSIVFDAVPGTGQQVTFYELSLHLGYCLSEELTTVYESNYASGSKKTVFETTNSITIQASSPEIVFETPFFYDPSTGNLIIDLVWPDGEGEFYSFNFATAGVSSVSGTYDDPDGYAFTDMSHLFINGALGFDQQTFAGIKASFR
jgi:hypothetical protein